MVNGLLWSLVEDRRLKEMSGTGRTPLEASSDPVMWSRTTKACEDRARALGCPFVPVERLGGGNPHKLAIEPWALRSERAKAARAGILAEAKRLGISTALPWRDVVKAVEIERVA